MNANELKLDYFQIYDLEPRVDLPRPARYVRIPDELDGDPQKAKVVSLVRFADRARKNKQDLYNKNAHLNWYRVMYPPRIWPIWILRIFNQFWPNGEELQIQYAGALLVPAQKRRIPLKEGFTEFPKLDHYKVYKVIQPSKVDYPPVSFQDQFIEREVHVIMPAYFALPVIKTLDDKEPVKTKLVKHDTYLIIYQVERSKKINTPIYTKDQFFNSRTGRKIVLGTSYLSAVPCKMDVLGKE